MSAWLWGILILSAGLFAVKMAYVFSTALVLPVTRGALYVSTSQARITAFLEAVPMQTGQLLVDIGCGDGRVLTAVRERYRADAVGYELNPLAWLRAQYRVFGIQGIKVHRRSFWKADLTGADTVFCYLFPDVMKDLAVKLRSELKPGAVVVSCNFQLPGFTPDTVLYPGGSLNSDPIFIYRMPTHETRNG